MNIAEIGNTWEGRVVDARLPLRQWLGSSDHSSVYLTEVAGPESPKAVVKIFPANFFDLDHQLARWRAASQLNSPSLLRVLDGGRSEIDGTPFFFVVTDFADEDLSQILPQRALTAEEVKDLLPPVLAGLAYLHQHGFVHGHIQPSNIMASGDRLKLPVERIYAVGELRDATGELTSYDAPEVAKGAVTPAADVWSLGMFLVAALKQRPVTLRNPQATPVIPGDIPEPLRSIAGDCLALDPKSRCTIAEIGAWLQPVPTPAHAPARPAPAKISAPVRIVEVHEATTKTSARTPAKTPVNIPAKIPAKSTAKPGHSAWRIAAPIAAVVLIGALVLGQKLLSHKNAPAPMETTQPVAADSSPADGVVHRVIPDIPANKRKTIRGQIKVSVQVDVDASGKVTAAKVISPASSEYLTTLAVQTAQQWQFSPAQNNGQPIPSTWLLRFQFARRSTQVFPLRVTQP